MQTSENQKPMRYELEDFLEKTRRERLLKRADLEHSAFEAARLRTLAAKPYQHEALPVRRRAV